LHLKLTNQLNNDWNEFDALVEKANSIILNQKIDTQRRKLSKLINQRNYNQLDKQKPVLFDDYL
jgi:hypothetical protein